MQTSRQNRTRNLFDEVGRGSDLSRALSLLADQVVADTGAPTCKIWVVKRGDICARCLLAESCTNRQMCMHLAAASGADMDEEYPRIPLAVFNAQMIARGGVAGFDDSPGAGEKLFGLQRGHNQSPDSFALYPLRGVAGTVGLIGIFNHRPLRSDELRALEELAPVAVAAIRVAELQARCDSLRLRLEKESADASPVQQSSARREAELEEAAAQATHLVAQLRDERESLIRASEEDARRIEQLEEQNRQLRDGALADAERLARQAASETASQAEAERRRAEQENAQLKARIVALEQSVSDLSQARESLMNEMAGRERDFERLKADLESNRAESDSGKAELEAARESLPKIEARALALVEENSLLRERLAGIEAEREKMREENTAILDSLNELERSLRIAEDVRARLEQSRLDFEQRIAELSKELERRRVENGRVLGENEQLVTENERLRSEMAELQGGGNSLIQENARLEALNEELASANALAEARLAGLEKKSEALGDQLLTARADSQSRIAELEQQNYALAEANSQLEAEAARLKSLAPEFEAEIANLKSRASELEGEVARLASRASELEQENEAVRHVNAQLEEATDKFESITSRLEESIQKLRTRAEAAERARAELEQRNRVLAEQNRRLGQEGQSRARFLANISHELRTPMNAIIGFTSLLSDDPSLQLSARHRSSLGRVARNARDLLELINNVLDLSKIEAGRMDVYVESADARDLIERAIGVVEPLKENRPVKIGLEIEEGLPSLRTDRTKLQQILINLLSNAIKFTNEGEVKVRAERAGPDRINIAVSDTGVGIAESDIAKIFEEFRQVGASARGARQGTGLGLTITRRLVELLGGEINVLSRLGEGSVFAVTLPIEIEGRTAATQESDAPTFDPQRTALVIDSDPALLYLTKKYLTEAGYSVVATDDAARGVEVARMTRPAVITIDLDLLEDGFGVIEQVARDDKSGGDATRAIVAISSEATLERGALDHGATAFLRKPVERESLIGLLSRASAAAPAHILVVDDDADALDLVVAMVEGSGYEIRTACDGREALDEIARSQPDLIILDLMLPEMDGFEVVHRLSLNSEWRKVPVILLTARDLSHEERRALDIGASRIIQKGNFSRDELLAEINLLVNKKSDRAST
jgi:signal transduction histidine kinase/DNA-binding response OmpR family regulator